MKTTKINAIKIARAEVGEIYYWGGQYRFNYVCHGMNAMRESNPTNYHAAKHERSQHLIDVAQYQLGLDSVEYRGGSWVDYVG